MKALPKSYNPFPVEKEIYDLWEKSGFFNPDNLPKSYQLKAKSFCVMLPPPNITGSLHMGHALNATIQDILIRQKRMQGLKTLWLPGTDHAGIATQNAVEKELKKEGKNRYDIGRENFIERVWQWKRKYGNIILDQLKKIGASCDWSRTRFTMDENYQKAVKFAFLHYFKKGLIYQGLRVVNWCPRCQTSLSDLELEYSEEKTKLYYIKYPLKAKSSKLEAGYIVVATTRPETMLGDAAVAVNPKDKRYKDLVKKFVILPIKNREIPIIADRRIDMNFGTGAVKVTPNHDLLDFEIAQKHKLAGYSIINKFGKMTKEAGAICEYLKTADCRAKVIEELEKQNLIEKIEDYTHNIAKCYRCGTTIEPLLSKQWFLKMKDLAKMTIKIVKSNRIKFHPKRFEKIYFDWLKNIKDWCISRQIWWGHQIPIFHCNGKLEFENQKSKIKNQKYLFQKTEKGHLIATEKNLKKCPIHNKAVFQEFDVLDTWFSSALWPFATLDWPSACAKIKNKKQKIKNFCKPNKNSDLDKFYPTQVLSTARDIINLWVARMIFSSLEFLNEIPFKDVIIHGTILTKEGKRMSKSLGTGIDPLNLIAKYGADATRFGLIYQMMGNQDIKFSEEALIAGKKFCNKIWNASRFVLGQTEISNFQFPISKQIIKSKNLTISDKKILNEFKKAKKELNRRLKKYEFGQALHKLYDFFWHNFCDIYIEESKKQMQDEKLKQGTQQLLLYILSDSLKLMHPFIPFITEKIYSFLPVKNKKLLMVENWPN